MHHDRSAKCYARMCRTWPYSLLCAYMRVSALLALWTETLFFNVYDRITVSKLHALSNRGDGHGFGDGHGLWFGRMVTVCIGGFSLELHICCTSGAVMAHCTVTAALQRRFQRVISSHSNCLVCVSAFSPPGPCSRMPSDTFWSDACRNAFNRPVPTRLDALRSSCGVTVRQLPLLPLGAYPAHVCVAGCFVCV